MIKVYVSSFIYFWFDVHYLWILSISISLNQIWNNTGLKPCTICMNVFYNNTNNNKFFSQVKLGHGDLFLWWSLWLCSTPVTYVHRLHTTYEHKHMKIITPYGEFDSLYDHKQIHMPFIVQIHYIKDQQCSLSPNDIISPLVNSPTHYERFVWAWYWLNILNI